MNRTSMGILTAAAALTLLAGCASDGDDSPSGDSDAPTTSTAAEAPPQDDGRALADWAATSFLAEKSTSLCPVSAEKVLIEFGKHGWCEADISLEETPVTLDLVGTCDTRALTGPAAPGDLYLYVVQPSIYFTKDETDNALNVTVEEVDGKWQIVQFNVETTSTADPKAPGCLGTDLQPLDESIALG